MYLHQRNYLSSHFIIGHFQATRNCKLFAAHQVELPNIDWGSYNIIAIVISDLIINTLAKTIFCDRKSKPLAYTKPEIDKTIFGRIVHTYKISQTATIYAAHF